MTGNGFGRTLRYAARQAEMYMLCIAAGSFGMAAWEWLVLDGDMTVMDMMKMVPSMLVWMSMLVILITGMSSGQAWYSMLIPYGCRRKNAFLGNLAMNLMMIAQSVVLFEILVLVLKPEEGILGIQAILAAYLALEGISQLIGAATIRWGKAAYGVMIVIIVFASLVLGFGYGFMSAYGVFDIQNDGFFTKMMTFIKQWWIVLAGAIACTVTNVIGWGMLRKYEVKA